MYLRAAVRAASALSVCKTCDNIGMCEFQGDDTFPQPQRLRGPSRYVTVTEIQIHRLRALLFVCAPHGLLAQSRKDQSVCLWLTGVESRDVHIHLALQVHDDPLPSRPADVSVALGVVELR